MNTENNHKERNNGRIIAAALIFATAGGALMSRLPQLLPGQQAIPWYHSGFFLAGITCVVIALLFLVPFSWWKGLIRFLINTPRNFKTIYWLQSVLHFNEQHINTAVQYRFLTTAPAWDFRGLTDNPLDPYFEIKLELINTSIFNLAVFGIEGEIRINGNKCTKNPTVYKQRGIKQGDIFYVPITQGVSGSMAKIIQEAAQKQEALIFDLGSIYLKLETTTRGYEGKKLYITFTSFKVIPDKS